MVSHFKPYTPTYRFKRCNIQLIAQGQNWLAGMNFVHRCYIIALYNEYKFIWLYGLNDDKSVDLKMITYCLFWYNPFEFIWIGIQCALIVDFYYVQNMDPKLWSMLIVFRITTKYIQCVIYDEGSTWCFAYLFYILIWYKSSKITCFRRLSKIYNFNYQSKWINTNFL